MPDLSANVERFTGFAEVYDRHRPKPPPVLRELLPRLAGVERSSLVVDLGCGTGLSTLFWSGHAGEIIGVDPSGDMRAQAEANAAANGATDVRFVAGFSTETGLPDACADLVTCSQSLHWMDPEPTFAEVARLLRPGGVFAAYDCDWPPTVDWEVEAAYLEAHRRAVALEKERNYFPDLKHWSKSEHLGRMRESGRFQHVKEILLHSVERGNAERFIGVFMSQGQVAKMLQLGVQEHEIGLDGLREVAQRVLGDKPRRWHWSYRLRVGVR
jgi:ubiquinone/menaquinone biosynthesis C-methylase UbiE